MPIINGAGGCYENRYYELDVETAWNLVLQVLNNMGVQVDSWDKDIHLVKFHGVKKQMQVLVKDMGNGTVEISMDSRGKRLLVYCWHKENKEVEMFFDWFEEKLHEFSAYVLCPTCGRQISSFTSVCPDCGQLIKH